MAGVDRDVVEIAAVLHHARECRDATKPYAQYSQRHRDVHEAFAEFFLSGLRDAGLAVMNAREGS